MSSNPRGEPEPQPARTESFFRYCNNWRADQMRSGRIAAALELLGVSNDDFEKIVLEAKSIWEGSGNQSVVLGKRERGPGYERKQKAKRDLRTLFPAVFWIKCRGREEQKFVTQVVPEAIIRHVNEMMGQRENSEARKAAVNSEDTTDEELDFERDADSMTGGEGNDSDLEEDVPVNKNRQATWSSRKRNHSGTAKDSPSTTNLLMEGEVEPNKPPKPTKRARTKPQISYLNKTQTQTQNKDEANIPKANTQATPAQLSSVLNTKEAEKEEKTRSGSCSDASQLAPAVPEASISQMRYVEVFAAYQKTELFQLNLNHLAKDQNSPFITVWPERLIFIHVIPGEGSRNILIFNQATLETAYQKWCDLNPAERTFRIYVNEYNGQPPKITLN